MKGFVSVGLRYSAVLNGAQHGTRVQNDGAQRYSKENTKVQLSTFTKLSTVGIFRKNTPAPGISLGANSAFALPH